MKIHRLVIISRIYDGHKIGASENTADLNDATEGLDPRFHAVNSLMAGEIVRHEIIAAGIRIRITLTPANAPSRKTLLRQKQEAIRT